MAIINTALTLDDLPPPPPGKTGWPWTEANNGLSERMPDGSEWPRISIVTPSYNYGHFIEETIRSVLLQGYPNLEYIITDGGSTDNTVEVIKKYEKYLAYWVSEPDDGQTDAINKGYQHCSGDIFVWLNADDSYTQITLRRVAENYLQGYQLMAGSCLAIYSDGHEEIFDSIPITFEKHIRFWLVGAGFTQPSVFVSKAIADKCFPLDKNLYMLMDYQFFLRVLSCKPKSVYLHENWVKFKFHGANKTMSNYTGGMSEFFQIAGSESVKLSWFSRLIFLTSLRDYSSLYSLLDAQPSATLGQVIATAFSRLTLLHWPRFWKVLTKTIVGENVYSAIKKINIKIIKSEN